MLLNQFLLLSARSCSASASTACSPAATACSCSCRSSSSSTRSTSTWSPSGPSTAQRLRPGLRPVRHRRGRRRGRRRPGHRAAHLPQPQEHRPRRPRPDEGLRDRCFEHAWIIPLIPACRSCSSCSSASACPFKGAEIGIAAVGIASCCRWRQRQWIDRVDRGRTTAEGARGRGRPRRTPPSSRPAGRTGPAEGRPTAAGTEPPPRGPSRVRRAVPSSPRSGPGSRERRGRPSGRHLVDGLTVMMLFVVTLISLLVHVYSTDYVAGDRRYTHYFAFLSLFTASMLASSWPRTPCS
jgi:hypothetical protein